MRAPTSSPAAPSFTLGDNVENLSLTGTGDIDGTGNALRNTIRDNAGINVLRGGRATTPTSSRTKPIR